MSHRNSDQPSRRNFLRGVGACVALPALESLVAPVAAAVQTGLPLATTATGAPMRMAFVFFPNGAHQKNWFPQDGAVLGKTMEPLSALQDSVQVHAGLDHEMAYPGHDGGGDMLAAPQRSSREPEPVRQPAPISGWESPWTRSPPSKLGT